MNAIAKNLGSEAAAGAESCRQQCDALQILHHILPRILRGQHAARFFRRKRAIRRDGNEIERFRNIAAVKKNFARSRRTSPSVVAATTKPPQSAAVDIIGMMFESRGFAEQAPNARTLRPASSAPTSNPATIAAALEPSPTPMGISFSISIRAPAIGVGAECGKVPDRLHD